MREEDVDAIAAWRRRRRVAAVLGVSALFVAGLVTARVQDSGAGTGHDPGSARARQMVHESTSLSSFVASPEDPDVRAAVWDVCGDIGPCFGHHLAMAVTMDGFATARYFLVSEASGLRWAGGDTFVTVLATGDVAMVSPIAPAQILPVSGRASAVRPRELLLYTFPGRPVVRAVAVDPISRTAHVVLAVPGSRAGVPELRNGVLWSNADDLILTSSDGGDSWRTHHDLPPAMLDAPVRSDAPQVDAFVAEGNDPIGRAPFYRSTDDGATWQMIDQHVLPDGWPTWSVVTPSGQLLAMYSFGNGSRSTVRLYESDTTSWTSFHTVDVRQPSTGSLDGLWLTTASQGQLTLYVADGSTVLASTDEGQSWSVTRDR